ncbi:hypothetical protein REPUB_Repub08aG0061300 [Reevesia pubescens]
MRRATLKQISDNEDSNISSIFEEACDFIDQIEQIGGRVLVHCFEGKSRSATFVIAYLMLRKCVEYFKQVHSRAQPNDGFARTLLDLDQKPHGKKAHKKLSSRSEDSAMTMEIQKALDALKMNRGGSVSPTQTQSHSGMYESQQTFLFWCNGNP